MKRIALFCVLLITCCPVFAQNYDEAKVPHYTLPDVLKTSSGKVIRNEEKWEKLRRPEVLKLFEDHVYGQMPTDYDSIRYALTEDDRPEMDGKAVLKQVGVTVFRKGNSVQINVVLFVPTQAKKPVPVFLLINNRGKENTDPTRAKKSEFWPAEMLIDSGFAIAAFHVSDLAPDDKDTYATGVLQKLYPEQLKKDNGMKAIGAWAWGASRVMDYFETDRDIDSKKVIVVGHSRGGKTSLWAAAQDRRFAACVTNCSGNTGAALARRQFGERITRINTTFPHWFNNNYKKYNDKENALPVDQHMLIALVAPRPVYATNASKDLWADPKGTFLALKAAEPVYALYNIKSGLPKDPPGIDKPVIGSHFGYHNREGEHNMTAYDWGNFIRFARKF
ncbi:Alpha/beta hydrolase family protein [Dyadobacter soli]|uniref:Alpha/beta hydrolase family protein n=1 Tax=Dyadobacter soli TaxID=659014 RepID=A0A1G7BSJ6_9BACT|nr:prolyl oligopeptidase family serine peptidase [Dyadobacter soli]SDE29957.1 Alpha/beta hydrolase family protein [Dyadobacter soli]